MKLALITGVSEYDTLNDIPCCENDVSAVSELITASRKYDQVIEWVNLSSDEFKRRIRAEIDRHDSFEEIFFYFSGHGSEQNGEFYYCTTNYAATSANTTGLADTLLDEMFRTGKCKRLIKVIDACQSGKQLIKDSLSFFAKETKKPLENFFRIAACTEQQTTRAGSNLSDFTENFLKAATFKEKGKVYYTDIAGYLADTYNNDDMQSPHLVAQGHERMYLCENAEILLDLRDKYHDTLGQSDAPETDSEAILQNVQSPEEALAFLERSFIDKESAQTFISKLSEDILEQAKSHFSVPTYYAPKCAVHNGFGDVVSRTFIAQVLSKQKRVDDFVTAKYERVAREKRRSVFDSYLTNIAFGLGRPETEMVEEIELLLNCEIKDIHAKIKFEPEFRFLKKYSLSCVFAPSLEKCFLFVIWRLHETTDWEGYDSPGRIYYKEWYQLDWKIEYPKLPSKILSYFNEIVSGQLDRAVEKVTSLQNGED